MSHPLTAVTDIKYVLVESFESADCFWKVLNKRVLINRNNTDWSECLSMAMPDQYGYAICRSAMARRSVKYSLCLSVKLCVVGNLYSFSFVLTSV